MTAVPDHDAQDLLRRAIALATANATAGQLPFGALVVREGEVLATGVNTALRDHDPAAHAEVTAVQAACRALVTLDLAGAVIVSSCQPCPMCEAVAVTAGISAILHAATAEQAARYGFDLRPAAARMRELWQRSGSSLAVHRPAADAESPFREYARVRGVEGRPA